MLQAVLDALADLDLVLARKQVHETHLAHVDAHGIRRAAELAVHRRERGLGLRLGVLVGDGLARALDEQLLLVGRDLVDLDVEVPENGDDRLDRVLVKERVRNVVVDLAVGDVAALLSERDELHEAGLPVLLALLLGAVAVLHRLEERLVAHGARAPRAAGLLRAVGGGAGAFRGALPLGRLGGVISLVGRISDVVEVRNVLVAVPFGVIVVKDVKDSALVVLEVHVALGLRAAALRPL